MKNIVAASTMLAVGLVINVGVYADSPHWNYEEQGQPGGWGAITGNDTPPPMNYPYAECAIGTKQTPVDIGNTAKTLVLNGLTNNWKPFTADFYNTGHAIQVQPVDASTYKGTTKVGKDVYPLLQAHLHAPSEHTVNGQKFSAEMHFVNIRNDGRITVVGLFINEGAANEQIQLMLDNTPNTPEVKTHNPTSIVFDPRKLLPKGNGKFFTYSGSLTTPPCTEGVNWYVYQKPITMSPEQLEKLKSFYERNDRDIQSLNGRELVTNK